MSSQVGTVSIQQITLLNPLLTTNNLDNSSHYVHNLINHMVTICERNYEALYLCQSPFHSFAKLSYCELQNSLLVSHSFLVSIKMINRGKIPILSKIIWVGMEEVVDNFEISLAKRV